MRLMKPRQCLLSLGTLLVIETVSLPPPCDPLTHTPALAAWSWHGHVPNPVASPGPAPATSWLPPAPPAPVPRGEQHPPSPSGAGSSQGPHGRGLWAQPGTSGHHHAVPSGNSRARRVAQGAIASQAAMSLRGGISRGGGVSLCSQGDATSSGHRDVPGAMRLDALGDKVHVPVPPNSPAPAGGTADERNSK